MRTKIIIEKSCDGRFLWNEILAGFVPVGKTEKSFLADCEQHLKPVFSCFQGQKKSFEFLKNIVISKLKSFIKWR